MVATIFTMVRISTLISEYDIMLENLTAVQARCTELLEENRKLKEEVVALQSWISTVMRSMDMACDELLAYATGGVRV